MQLPAIKSSCLATAVILTLAAAGAQAGYRLSTLGDHIDATALNDLGQVVGNDSSGVVTSPYIWSGGTTTLLGGLNVTSASDINNLGQVTGTFTVIDSHGAHVSHAYRYAGGVVTDLDPAGLGSSGQGINDHGVVAGSYTPADGHVRSGAALFAGGSVQDLNVPPSINGNSSANAINGAGQVTGSGGGGSGRFEPFLYSGGTVTPLGNLGGEAGHGLGINSAGVVVGDAETVDFVSHAFIYSGGVKTNLDPLGLYAYSSANAINDAGLVVGTATCITGSPHCSGSGSFAFLSYGVAGIADLNDLSVQNAAGWKLQDAVDVNNRGQIVGYGLDASGKQRAFLLTPIPEPTSTALMLAGLGVLGALAWRRRR